MDISKIDGSGLGAAPGKNPARGHVAALCPSGSRQVTFAWLEDIGNDG